MSGNEDRSANRFRELACLAAATGFLDGALAYGIARIVGETVGSSSAIGCIVAGAAFVASLFCFALISGSDI